jgi:scytalone dehydratase
MDISTAGLKPSNFKNNCQSIQTIVSLTTTQPEYLAIRNLAFEWSESYDTKDWPRLRNILAPSTSLDFRSLRGELHENLSPDEYVAILSSTKLLGDPRMKTQHLLGASKRECLDDGSVQVGHQIRVAHQRYIVDPKM